MNKSILLFCYLNLFGIGLVELWFEPAITPSSTEVEKSTLHSPCTTRLRNYRYEEIGHCVPYKRCCSSFNSDVSQNLSGNCKQGTYCCTERVYCQGCEDGYRKENDTCIDINECDEKYGLCSGHNCINTNGSFECQCFDDFEMTGDVKTCRHVNNTGIHDILISASLSINLIPFNTLLGDVFIETDIKMLYSGTVFPKSIDYSFVNNYMAWTDNALRQIIITPINYKNPSLIINIKVLRNLKNPDILAIDWIHDLIYWTDLETRTINVMNIYNHEEYYTLINTTNNIPNDLIVNVLDSCLIWTYIDIQSRIMRSNQDGSQLTPFYATFKHPFHLIIDTILKRYFFIDIEDSTLYSIDFKGKDERKHFQSKKLLIGINSALIFGDNIFLLTDSYFFKLNKFGHDFDETTIASTLQIKHELSGNFKNRQLLDFKILDPILQPQIENKCLYAKCSHLCLPSDERQIFRCLCPQKYLLINKTICVQKKFENLILESMEWERDLQLLINQSISKSFDLRKLFNKSIERENSDNESISSKTGHQMTVLADSGKNGYQVILILNLITIMTILIILIMMGFKLNLFRMKTKFKYSSQLRALYRKTDDNSIEEIESKA